MEDFLKKLREELGGVDDGIVCLLEERNEVVKRIAEFKKEHNLPARDEEQHKKVRANFQKLAADYGISKQMAKEIYEIIHRYSVEEQEKILNKQ